jgi:ectoine hydroxylase-related dioxygenase (phytanoyl-CoA dioxygenase family)
MPTAAAQAFTPSADSVAELELDARGLDPRRAAEIYRRHGCLVVRDLMRAHVDAIVADIEAAAREAIALLPTAVKIVEGWSTPDGTLFLPAPAHFGRAQQIMVLGCDYRTSAAFMRSALDSAVLDIVACIHGPDIELHMDGQVLYKEATGGHPKHLHQDASYFTHRHDGPVAMLCYGIDTDVGNGALRVVPGSHRLGLLPHVDTFSHLGLDPAEWPWERSLPISGRAGDAILFHVDTIHGSQENRSDRPRPAFIHRYRRADDYVIVQASTTENRSAAERLLAAASKRTQRGLMVRGRRRQEGAEVPSDRGA